MPVALPPSGVRDPPSSGDAASSLKPEEHAGRRLHSAADAIREAQEQGAGRGESRLMRTMMVGMPWRYSGVGIRAVSIC